MKLVLPWPPSVNHYWRSTLVPISKACQLCKRPRFGLRILISKEGRQYRIDAQAAILSSVGKPETICERCQLDVLVFPPDRRARDIDNLTKGLCDALTYAGVIQDDRLIDRLMITRGPVSLNPRVEVSVEVMVKGERQGSLIG